MSANTLLKFRVIQSLDQALVDRRRTGNVEKGNMILMLNPNYSPPYERDGGNGVRIVDDEEQNMLTSFLDIRIRYPDPAIKANDTVKVDIATGKIVDFVRFDTGVVIMATGGRNMGRVGVVTHRERHDGGFNIVHVKDAVDNAFATRESNVFVIGHDKPWISLPKGKGVKVRLVLLRYKISQV